MKREYVTVGTTIDTLVGYIKVLGYNGNGLFDCNIHELDDNSQYTTERRYLTASDIQSYMKEVDGKNHKIEWEEPEEEGE